MKRILFAALLLLVFAFPAIAQETDEPAPPVPTVEVTEAAPVETPAPEPPVVVIPGTDYSPFAVIIIVLAATLIAVIAIFGATIVLLARNALNTLPRWMVERIRANAPPLLDQLDKVTDIPNTDLDDMARARLRKLIGEILAEQTPPATPEKQVLG